MEKYIENEYRNFFKKVSQLSRTKKSLKIIFCELLALEGLAIPKDYIVKILSSQTLLYSLIIDIRFKMPKPQEIDKYLKNLRPQKIIDQSKYSLQLRRLGSQGLYPNYAFSRRNFEYTFVNGCPVLITKNSWQAENYYSNGSELSFMSREELKFSTALLCCSKEPGYTLDYLGRNTVGLNAKHLLGLSNEKRLEVLIEWDTLVNHFQNDSYETSKTKPFLKSDLAIDEFNEYYDNFSIRDQLMMRTSFLYVKAKMLWLNPSFHEDALANIFFCIEGALLLIQRRNHHSHKQINMSFLKSHLIKLFPHGKYFFEFIEEAYQKRIEIVHPQNRWGSKWSPTLFQSDFQTFSGVAKQLLILAIADKVVNPYEY